ncbi:hypothetical protein M407DRAFT_84039, partial [Tulasnella calospora MUT 4182]
MFPTLFPLGVSGFDDPNRPVPIGSQKQADYYFDTYDKSFRNHRLFMFVVLNIFQKRATHLHTYFSTRKSNFDLVAQKLSKLTPEVITSVADHLEREGKFSDLSPAQREVLELLRKVDTIAARVPGSHASKIFTQNEIRAYMGYFRLPAIYLTMNPSPMHSPIFQVMCGDKTIDLSKRFPMLVGSRERALQLASDPVAAADFFNFSIEWLFQKMLGWNPETRKSSLQGGILGRLKAYYGTAE